MKKCDACGKTGKTVTDGYITICKKCLPKNRIAGYCNNCGDNSLLLKPVPVVLPENKERLACFFLQMCCPKCKAEQQQAEVQEFSYA